MSSTRYVTLMLFAAVISAGSQAAPPEPSQATAQTNPSVVEIAASYHKFQKITETVVFVNPKLAMLCAGASKEQVDAARIRFGPHANTGILIYMNTLAADSFRRGEGAFPVGAVVVKQKAIQQRDNGVGGMVKRPPGYDPEHGDWEYFYFEDATSIESGRIPSCVSCHDSAKDKDHVFGTWRK